MAQNLPVVRRQVGVRNELGLHLRVAGRFVKMASAFQSEVKVHYKGIIADGRSILSLLSLAAEYGTMLAVEAHGCDAEDAVAALADLISTESHESEDRLGDSASQEPETRSTAGPPKDDSASRPPAGQRSDSGWKSGPKWDSWRRGSTSGTGIDRGPTAKGQWLRR